MTNKKRDRASEVLSRAAGDPRLTGAGLRVVALVCGQDTGDGVAATLSELGERLGLSRSMAWHGQRQARECGYISRSGVVKRRSIYRVAA